MKKTTLLRKIAFAFSAVLLSSTMTFAQEDTASVEQRKTNLEVTLSGPEAGKAYTVVTDTFEYTLKVKNLGPDDLKAGDTLGYSLTFITEGNNVAFAILKEDLLKDQELTLFTDRVNFTAASQSGDVRACGLVVWDNKLISLNDSTTLGDPWIDLDSTNNQSCIEFKIHNPTSINEISAADFSVFPNPATANLTINAGTLPAGNYTLQLVNVTGQVVNQQQINLSNNTVNVPVADFARGVYFIKISNEGNSYQQRVVLQ